MINQVFCVFLALFGGASCDADATYVRNKDGAHGKNGAPGQPGEPGQDGESSFGKGGNGGNGGNGGSAVEMCEGGECCHIPERPTIKKPKPDPTYPMEYK